MMEQLLDAVQLSGEKSQRLRCLHTKTLKLAHHTLSYMSSDHIEAHHVGAVEWPIELHLGFCDTL